nr:MAG TPA: hypothetical protein [Caudoviricetes sp.]
MFPFFSFLTNHILVFGSSFFWCKKTQDKAFIFKIY